MQDDRVTQGIASLLGRKIQVVSSKQDGATLMMFRPHGKKLTDVPALVVGHIEDHHFVPLKKKGNIESILKIKYIYSWYCRFIFYSTNYYYYYNHHVINNCLLQRLHRIPRDSLLQKTLSVLEMFPQRRQDLSHMSMIVSFLEGILYIVSHSHSYILFAYYLKYYTMTKRYYKLISCRYTSTR